jgi:hypothetical protein
LNLNLIDLSSIAPAISTSDDAILHHSLLFVTPSVMQVPMQPQFFVFSVRRP